MSAEHWRLITPSNPTCNTHINTYYSCQRVARTLINKQRDPEATKTRCMLVTGSLSLSKPTYTGIATLDEQVDSLGSSTTDHRGRLHWSWEHTPRLMVTSSVDHGDRLRWSQRPALPVQPGPRRTHSDKLFWSRRMLCPICHGDKLCMSSTTCGTPTRESLLRSATMLRQGPLIMESSAGHGDKSKRVTQEAQ